MKSSPRKTGIKLITNRFAFPPLKRLSRRPGFTIIQIVVLSLLAGKVQADRAQALQSEVQGNYSQAAKQWLELANTGDPVAQFNLALHYKRGNGVLADNNLYKYWLAKAAQQKFAEAYMMLNPQALRPTKLRVHINLQQDPQAWLASQKPGNYTLQLASSTSQSQIRSYYLENNLAGKGGYYHTRRSSQDWYSLVYGSYSTVEDAKQAIDTLPGTLKKWSPWVRNIKSIQRIMIR